MTHPSGPAGPGPGGPGDSGPPRYTASAAEVAAFAALVARQIGDEFLPAGFTAEYDTTPAPAVVVAAAGAGQRAHPAEGHG